MSPRISWVASATETETRKLKVTTVLEAIRTGGKELRGQITQIRNRFESELAIKGGELKAARLAVEQLKKALPAVTWSGRFSYRASDKLQEYSGLIIADLDGLGDKLPEIRKKLEASPHVFAVFLSPTGNGLKAVIRVPADVSKHAGSFRAIQKHVLEQTGIKIDESGKDPARLCFMSYDPELYHNPNATELEPLPEPEKPKARVSRSTGGNSKPSKAEVREMLAGIPKRPQYHDWIKLVAAVGDALPDEDAIEVLNEWSPEESRGEYAAKLRKRLKDVHVGTLVHLARQHGYSPVDQARAAQSEPENENNETATIARLAALPPIEYDRIRFNEADKLGVRVTTLDAEVERKRAKAAEGETLQGNAVDFLDVEPYETLVNGAQVLDEVAATFSRYLGPANLRCRRPCALGDADALR